MLAHGMSQEHRRNNKKQRSVPLLCRPSRGLKAPSYVFRLRPLALAAVQSTSAWPRRHPRHPRRLHQRCTLLQLLPMLLRAAAGPPRPPGVPSTGGGGRRSGVPLPERRGRACAPTGCYARVRRGRRGAHRARASSGSGGSRSSGRCPRFRRTCASGGARDLSCRASRHARPPPLAAVIGQHKPGADSVRRLRARPRRWALLPTPPAGARGAEREGLRTSGAAQHHKHARQAVGGRMRLSGRLQGVGGRGVTSGRSAEGGVPTAQGGFRAPPGCRRAARIRFTHPPAAAGRRRDCIALFPRRRWRAGVPAGEPRLPRGCAGRGVGGRSQRGAGRPRWDRGRWAAEVGLLGQPSGRARGDRISAAARSRRPVGQ